MRRKAFNEMRKQNSDGNKLNRLGGKVLASAIVPETEIDRVIGSPRVFESIKQGIRAERSRRELNSAVRHNPVRQVWDLRLTALAGFAVVAMFAGLGLFEYGGGNSAPLDTSSENGLSFSVEKAIPVPVSDPGLDGSTQQQPVRAERSAIARRVRHDAGRAARNRSIARREPRDVEEVGPFQSLTFAGEVDASKEDGQIVRVELPRSSLFAMGIDVPVENEKNNKVRADLLIGDDGVMKAVRLVGAN